MSKEIPFDDWVALEWEVTQLFDGAPIDEAELFAGRINEIGRIFQAVIQRSKGTYTVD